MGNKKTRGKLEQESIFVGVQVSGVYLSTGDTVVNRKAYLWEFEYLVRIYLREQQWATKKANSEKKTGTVYLSLFSEKVVLCVCVCYVLCCVVCCVVLCVGLSKGSNGFPRGASCVERRR